MFCYPFVFVVVLVVNIGWKRKLSNSVRMLLSTGSIFFSFCPHTINSYFTNATLKVNRFLLFLSFFFFFLLLYLEFIASFVRCTSPAVNLRIFYMSSNHCKMYIVIKNREKKVVVKQIRSIFQNVLRVYHFADVTLK